VAVLVASSIPLALFLARRPVSQPA
jgi:hypothetical protein